MRFSKKLGFGIALTATLISYQRANAGDLLFLMTSLAYQDSIAIGEILSLDDNQLTFKSRRVLSGDRIANQITIAGYTSKQVETLSVGDFAVLSLVRADRGKHYKLSAAAFKVSSREPNEAEIIAGPLSGGDRTAYNWFINSCGTEKDFAFDYSGEVDVAFVRRETGLHAIAQRSVDRPDGIWEEVAEPAACKPKLTWWRALLEQLGSISMTGTIS